MSYCFTLHHLPSFSTTPATLRYARHQLTTYPRPALREASLLSRRTHIMRRCYSCRTNTNTCSSLISHGLNLQLAALTVSLHNHSLLRLQTTISAWILLRLGQSRRASPILPSCNFAWLDSGRLLCWHWNGRRASRDGGSEGRVRWSRSCAQFAAGWAIDCGCCTAATVDVGGGGLACDRRTAG